METVRQDPGLNPRVLLQQELSRRCARNPRYSLRSFSRALGLSHTLVSLIISGKRPLSKKAALKISDALGFDPQQKRALLEKSTAQKFSAEEPTGKYGLLELDKFEIISDWHHYAILSLLEIPKARFEARWIAERLGISEIIANLAMERLQRLGFVHCDEKGRWKQSVPPIKVDNAVSTAATRKFHRQMLERAIESLENDATDLRSFSSMTFALDPSLVPYAAKRIMKFRRKLVEELEKMGAPQEVYKLTVQLFPVTRVKRK